MTQDRLEAVVLQAAEAACELTLPEGERKVGLEEIASVLFSAAAEEEDAYAALGTLIERRLARAMEVAFDLLKAPRDKRAEVRFAREDLDTLDGGDTYLPTIGPDGLSETGIPEALTGSSILFTNQAGAATLTNPGGSGQQTLELGTGAGDGVQGRVGASLTVVTIGRGLGDLENVLLGSAPTAKRDHLEAASRGQDLVGEVLDEKYRVDDFLGKGGFGSVYKGVEISTGAEVAIKVMHPAVAIRNRANSNFTAEAQRLTRCTHPGIVQWKTYSPKADGISYLVMEYFAGKELGDVLEEEELTEGEVRSVLLQVLDALRAAHNLPNGEVMLHLDLKPSNVLIARGPEGDDPTVKLIDFGIGQYSGEEGSSEMGTQSGDGSVSGSAASGRRSGSFGAEGSLLSSNSVRRAAGGTALYASPEQCRHLRRDRKIEELDVRSDLYSFGVLAYKVLSGEYPYPGFRDIEDSLRSGQSRGEAYLEAFRIHIDEPHRPLREVAPNVDKRLAAAVERCLAKEPGKRFADTAEAHETFCDILEEKPWTLGFVAAGVLGLALVGATWFLTDREQAGTALGMDMPVMPFAGADLRLSDARKELVASPAGGPTFRLIEGAAAANDLQVVTSADGQLVEGVRLVPDPEDAASVQLLAQADAQPFGPEKVVLSWANGDERSMEFELRTIPAITWGDQPAGLMLAAASGQERDLLAAEPPAVLVADGQTYTLRVDTSDIADRLRTDPMEGASGLRVVLGGRARPVPMLEQDGWLELELAASDLRQAATDDVVELRFEADAIDGQAYDLSWSARIAPVLAQARPGTTEVELVASASGQVLQKADSVPSDLGGDSFSLVRRQEHEGRSVDELGFLVRVPITEGGAGYVVQLLDGTEVVASAEGDGSAPAALTWPLPEAAESESLEARELAIAIDQSGSVLGAIGGPAQRRVIRIDYDPIPVRFTATLVQAGRSEVLERASSAGAGAPDFELLPEPIAIQVAGRGERLVVAECGSGESMDRQIALSMADEDLTLSVERDPSGDPLDLVVRVWSVHELPAGLDLQSLEESADGCAPGTSWTVPGGYATAGETYRARIAVAAGLGLNLSLEGADRTLLLGELQEPQVVQLAEAVLRCEILSAVGSPALEAVVTGTQEKLELEPSADGNFLLRLPATWDEQAQDGADRLIELRASDDLRMKEFTLELAFSSTGPKAKVNEPGTGRDWTPRESGLLSIGVQLTDPNGVADARARVRWPDQSEEEYPLTPEGSVARYWQAQVKAKMAWSGGNGSLVIVSTDRAGLEAESETIEFEVAVIEPTYSPRVGSWVATAEGVQLGTTEMILVKVPAASNYLFRELDPKSVSDALDQLAANGVEYFQDTSNRGRYLEGRETAGGGTVALEFSEDASYYLDKHEVTVGQYRDYLKAVGSQYGKGPSWRGGQPGNSRGTGEEALAFFKGRAADTPVVGVNWFEASAYAEWAGKRLPTWFEWECAVRGGIRGERFFALQQPFGQGAQCFAWVGVENAPLQPALGLDIPMSREGFLHLCGNTSEWTSTPETATGTAAVVKPYLAAIPGGTQSDMRFVLVGGSISRRLPFHDFLAVGFERPKRTGTGLENDGTPTGNDRLHGFRCAVDASIISGHLAGEAEQLGSTGWAELPN